MADNIGGATGASNGNQTNDFMSVFEEPVEQTGNNEGAPSSAQQGEVEIEIDSRFEGLPREQALIRTLQSRVDSTTSQLTKAQQELLQASQFRDLFAELMTDDTVFESFLAERKPELLQKSTDPSTQIQTALKQKWGDFTPDTQEMMIPGTKSWLYNKDAESMYSRMTGNESGKKLVPLKELRENRKREAEAQRLTMEQEIGSLKEKMKWDDGNVQSFVTWAKSLTTADLAKIYNFASRNSVPQMKSNVSVPGAGKAGTSARSAFLNDIQF